MFENDAPKLAFKHHRTFTKHSTILMRKTQNCHIAILVLSMAILGLTSACQDRDPEPSTDHKWALPSQHTEKPEWSRYFEAEQVHGTLVVYDFEQDHFYAYNPHRADSAYIPASTFKILNSMIILETGTVANEQEMVPWDGVKRFVPAWNKDHNLRSAIKVSAVWFYQEMARRIGEETMQGYINNVGYGNQDISGGIDQFWLDGGLRITAYEQIDLLQRLHLFTLPFSDQTHKKVKSILTQEVKDGYVLRAKTGWGRGEPHDLGWYVGYVERTNRTLFFALNIDMYQNEDARKREAITRKVLEEMGAFEGS